MSALDNTNHRLEDHQIELTIGTLLRVGVMLAAAVVLFGGVLYLVRYGGMPVPNYKTFHGSGAPRSISAIISESLALHDRAIIELGLLLLIATPVARVIFSAVAFAFEKDWLYVYITLFVLAVLLFSLFGHTLM
ncbi:MAG: DUF1634 domain-containing protein [Candidatus Korobacteraceae bacterium]|jgi:uncharacterized membrane protein